MTESISEIHVYGPIIADIKFILGKPWCSRDVTHAFREANQCADAMTKIGVHEQLNLKIWHSPPAFVQCVPV